MRTGIYQTDAKAHLFYAQSSYQYNLLPHPQPKKNPKTNPIQTQLSTLTTGVGFFCYQVRGTPTRNATYSICTLKI